MRNYQKRLTNVEVQTVLILLDGCCFAVVIFVFFLADALLVSSLLEQYDNFTPSSVAMCFKPYPIYKNRNHCKFNALWCVDVQSLFLCTTAFVVAENFDHIFYSIIEKTLNRVIF